MRAACLLYLLAVHMDYIADRSFLGAQHLEAVSVEF